MNKHISFTIRNLVFCFAILFTSCGELIGPSTEFYYVSSESKKWLIDTDKYEEFTMVDSLAYSEYFELTSEWEAFNSSKSTSGFLGLQDREYKKYEVIHQEYLLGHDKRFSIELEGAKPPDGQIFCVRLENNHFSYDLFYRKLISIGTESGRRPYSEFINDKMVEHPILSFTILHDTLNINDVGYYDVLEFVLDDFKDQWVESTIVSISMAKEVGLLQYKLHSGLVFNRVVD